jgi:hypothetical protein
LPQAPEEGTVILFYTFFETFPLVRYLYLLGAVAAAG